ncbi:Ca-activated chloride channel family protein [Roseivirga pacifica]|uniref:Ca-activated chloride channel family protein n=2 Tax=Roseivirga pacifica TaxID=1267423 RepID=A0A1I0RA73_9BACT|nr:Ca-activated chloride channel family protein [Roseivirga pacifica]SEW37669.1 Ca-activated chloride channel family protein [Roseivirga pacifica]
MMTLLVGFHNPVEQKSVRTISGKVIGADDGLPLPGVKVLIKGSTKGTQTDANGHYSIQVETGDRLVFSFLGYKTEELKLPKTDRLNVKMKPDVQALGEVVVTGYAGRRERKSMSAPAIAQMNIMVEDVQEEMDIDFVENDALIYFDHYIPETNRESYAKIEENGFQSPWKNPYSTFSIDVDAAAYSNMRRFINNGSLPPKDAVKLEEMINYFDYDYEGPRGKHPFAVSHEVSQAPWNEQHQLVHIGIQGEKMEVRDLPPSNLVFLLDVSGSMNSPDKLPLLKKSLRLLVDEMREEDRVAIVVYAGAAGEVLPSTSGKDKHKILAALDKLSAGGSTAGGAGIQLAYKIAQRNFLEDGNNRIILATDGDFNVGASSDKAMEEFIEEKRKSGVFLTVLGFGTGNYMDSKMEVLADKGNGNHAYIDNLLEAKKVLVNEFGGTLFTIAKDVKLQVEFNPATVQAYRLIGYENRKLNDEDFNNDKKDAGELGAGHSVTALYEVIPVGVESSFIPLDDLKYQQTAKQKLSGNTSDLMTVKLRYKKPDEDTSIYLDTVIKNQSVSLNRTSENFRWSAAVAGFGMLLRGTDYAELNYNDVIKMAKNAKGADEFGYRAEMIKLAEMAQLLTKVNE